MKNTYTAFLLLCTSFLVSPGDIASAAQQQYHLGTIRPAHSAVAELQQVAPAFITARQERVAWVNIGDSNMLLNGYGWDSGIAQALGTTFGLWGTGVQPINGDGRWSTSGFLSQQLFGSLAHSGAPAELDRTMATSNATPFYAFVANGSNVANVGMIYTGGGQDHVLRYHFTYGTAPGWTGSFTPSIRLGVFPYTEYVAGPAVSTARNTYSLIDASIDLPAGTAPHNTPLNMRLHTNSSSVQGTFFGTTQWTEDTSAQRGFAVSLLGAYPSHSTQDMLTELRTFGVPALSEYFRQVRAGLGPHTAVVVGINEGLNDRNDHDASVGPVGGLDSSTPAGFGDNTRGIIDLIVSTWTTNNWDLSNLYFVIYPSHPVSTPDDTLLSDYRVTAETIAREYPRTAAVSIDRLITSSEMSARNYYNSTTDHYHLNQAGYDAIGSLIIKALTNTLVWPRFVSGSSE